MWGGVDNGRRWRNGGGREEGEGKWRDGERCERGESKGDVGERDQREGGRQIGRERRGRG